MTSLCILRGTGFCDRIVWVVSRRFFPRESIWPLFSATEQLHFSFSAIRGNPKSKLRQKDPIESITFLCFSRFQILLKGKILPPKGPHLSILLSCDKIHSERRQRISNVFIYALTFFSWQNIFNLIICKSTMMTMMTMMMVITFSTNLFADRRWESFRLGHPSYHWRPAEVWCHHWWWYYLKEVMILS